ncbi:hypothetical protein EDD84_17745 [Burkholderia gladioli]|nr:hypothetical protein EDD84_17745 [Burkholderia gladioli]
MGRHDGAMDGAGMTGGGRRHGRGMAAPAARAPNARPRHPRGDPGRDADAAAVHQAAGREGKQINASAPGITRLRQPMAGA